MWNADLSLEFRVKSSELGVMKFDSRKEVEAC